MFIFSQNDIVWWFNSTCSIQCIKKYASSAKTGLFSPYFHKVTNSYFQVSAWKQYHSDNSWSFKGISYLQCTQCKYYVFHSKCLKCALNALYNKDICRSKVSKYEGKLSRCVCNKLQIPAFNVNVVQLMIIFFKLFY